MSSTTIEMLPVRTIMRSSGTLDDVVKFPPNSDEGDVTVIEGAGMVSLPNPTDAVTGGETPWPESRPSFVPLLQAAAVAMTSMAVATNKIFFNWRLLGFNDAIYLMFGNISNV